MDEQRSGMSASADGRWHCTKCPKSYTTKSSLTRHLARHGEPQHRCGFCTAVYYRIDSLNDHRRSCRQGLTYSSQAEAHDASLGSNTSVGMGESRTGLNPHAHRSAFPSSNEPMALQPGPGGACIANEDVASCVLDCIPDIGGLDISHNKNQTKGELQQAKSTNLRASRPDAERGASSTPNTQNSPESELAPGPDLRPRPQAPTKAVPRSKAARGTRTTRGNPDSTSAWSTPGHADWDIQRVLNSDECLAPDPLLTLPKPDYTYLTAAGKLKNPNKYAMEQKAEELHPKYLELVKKGTATHAHYLYYRGMERHQHAPIAGIPRNQPEQGGSEVRDSGPRSDSVSGLATQTNDVMTNDGDFQEEQFLARPSIKLVVPDHIKAILVDDWENVTKNLQLVPLPAAKPVNLILNDYLQYEKPRRQAGSAQADILDEVVAGLKEYFEKCLGRILLYRFERHQYSEVREGMAKNTGDFAGKGPGDIYGAEHLCRLLVSLPELIAQTNMDHQSVNRLREELSKLTNWLGRNYLTYFVSEYEIPGQEYIEKAKSL